MGISRDLALDLAGVPYCLRCANEAIAAGILQAEDFEVVVEWGDVGDPPQKCPRCGRVITNPLDEVSGIPELQLVEDDEQQEGEADGTT